MKSTEITDFNDLAKAKGIQAVHDLVANVIANPPTKVEEVEEKKGDYVTTKVEASMPIPDLLESFPVDILNELSDWIEGFSREPNPQITMMTTLSLASTLCGRMYCSVEGNTTSIFSMILAETGVGKNYAKTSIQKFFAEVQMTELLSGSVNTASGAVFTALVQAPCHIQIVDEIGKQLQAARKQSSGMMAEALSTLVECYSSTTGLIIPKNYSNMGAIAAGKAKENEKIVIHCPAITLLGLATPSQVYDNLSTVEIEDGFLNRLIVCDVTAPSKPKQRQRKVPVPRHIAQWAMNIRNPPQTSLTSLAGVDTGYASSPVQQVVEVDEDAYELFSLKEEELSLREANGDFVLPDMTRRWVENAMRIATCMAVCENALDPVVDLRLAHWSMVFSEYYGNEFMIKASANVSDIDFHKLYFAIVELVLQSEDKGITEYELSRKSRLYASTAPSHRDQALGALQREGRIQQFKVKPSFGGGRPKLVWIADKFITDELIAKSVK